MALLAESAPCAPVTALGCPSAQPAEAPLLPGWRRSPWRALDELAPGRSLSASGPGGSILPGPRCWAPPQPAHRAPGRRHGPFQPPAPDEGLHPAGVHSFVRGVPAAPGRLGFAILLRCPPSSPFLPDFAHALPYAQTGFFYGVGGIFRIQ